jgi:hypothetical protein
MGSDGRLQCVRLVGVLVGGVGGGWVVRKLLLDGDCVEDQGELREIV